MKALLTLALLSFSLTSFAETCKTAEYGFEITKKTISFSEHASHVTNLKITLNKTLTTGSDFVDAVESMKSDIVSDSPITSAMGASIVKILMKGAEGRGNVVGMVFAKAFDKNGKVVTRFIMTEGGYFRCL